MSSHQAQETAPENWVPHEFRAAGTLRDRGVWARKTGTRPKSSTDRGSGSRPPVPEVNSSYVVTGRLPGCGSWSAPGVAVEGRVPGRLAFAPPSNLPWSFLIFKDSFGVPGFPHVTKSPHLLPSGGPRPRPKIPSDSLRSTKGEHPSQEFAGGRAGPAASPRCPLTWHSPSSGAHSPGPGAPAPPAALLPVYSINIYIFYI